MEHYFSENPAIKSDKRKIRYEINDKIFGNIIYFLYVCTVIMRLPISRYIGSANMGK